MQLNHDATLAASRGVAGSQVLLACESPRRSFRVAHNHEAWCRLRRLGPFRFVLFYGVLGWGLPFGLLFPGTYVVLVRVVDDQAPSYSEIMPWMLPLGLLSGIGFGWWIWVLGEQGHRRWSAQSESRERAA